MAAPPVHLNAQIDVARILHGLSQFDRVVAISLMEYSASETSRRLGAARSTVYEAIQRLRLCFSGAGYGLSHFAFQPSTVDPQKKQSQSGQPEAVPPSDIGSS